MELDKATGIAKKLSIEKSLDYDIYYDFKNSTYVVSRAGEKDNNDNYALVGMIKHPLP